MHDRLWTGYGPSPSPRLAPPNVNIRSGRWMVAKKSAPGEPVNRAGRWMDAKRSRRSVMCIGCLFRVYLQEPDIQGLTVIGTG